MTNMRKRMVASNQAFNNESCNITISKKNKAVFAA
jgi:hypothetical protein